MGCPPDATAVELGGPPRNGRPIFAWRHVPVEVAPARPAGAVSPPGLLHQWHPGQSTLRLPTVEFREQRVAVERDRFFGTTADLAAGELVRYLGRYFPPRGNTSQEEILDHLGCRHITAHVNFTALAEHGTGTDSEPNGSRPRHRLCSRLVLRSSSVPPSAWGRPGEPRGGAVCSRRHCGTRSERRFECFGSGGC
jgi:hypothetical protein